MVRETVRLRGESASDAATCGVALLTDSAEVQLYEQREHAGHSTLTVGVLPLEPERGRLVEAGLEPGPIEEADDYFIMRIRDPDQNLVVFASAKRD